MQALGFYLVYPLLYALSLLPFPLLYRVSDGLFVLLYYVAGYRKKVVRANLRNAFPEASESELNKTERDFYRYLADLVVETLKLMSVSPETMRQRIRFTNPQLFDELKGQGHKLVIVALGHQCNWEWASPCTTLHTPHPLLAVYKKLANPYFDRMFRTMRGRFGATLVPMEQTLRQVITHRNDFHILALIADQTPSSGENATWVTFLNQDTPVLSGAATLSRKFNAPLVFANLQQEKRGSYAITLEVLTESPASLSEPELTELHTQRLEAAIRQQPARWLWSHRRWKHKRKIS